MKQVKVPINLIDPKDRYRTDFGNLAELKLSIQKDGLISPIAVQALPDDRFRLLAGERRLRACKDLGWAEIDAKVWPIEPALSELDVRCIELAENLHRKDFTWQEKVRLEAHIHSLQVGVHGEKVGNTGTGHSQADTARFLGTSKGALSQDLKLARAIDVVPELNESKTKEEAMKKLRLLQETAIHEELLKRAHADEDEAAVPEQDKQLTMCSAFILGDARELILHVGNEEVDFIEIDPPYSVGLNEVKQGQQAGKEEYTEVAGIDYYTFMGTILDEAIRALKPGRWLILWHAEEHEATLKGMLKARGMSVGSSAAIWVKPTGQTNHPEYEMGSAYERFFYASKGNAVLLKQGRANVFTFSPVPPQRKIHPTEKPIEMLQAVFSCFTMKGQSALVPFLGSGASLMALANAGVEAYGFDLSPVFKRSYEVRILSQQYGKYFNTTAEGK